MKLDGIQPYLLVGAGGFVGSVLRYSVSGWAQRLDPAGSFPIGTLTVNVLGCLAMGLLAGLAEARGVLGPEARLFVWYAGHGHTERGQGYLVPADAPRPQEAATGFLRKALSMRRFGDFVRQARSKHAQPTTPSRRQAYANRYPQSPGSGLVLWSTPGRSTPGRRREWCPRQPQ